MIDSCDSLVITSCGRARHAIGSGRVCGWDLERAPLPDHDCADSDRLHKREMWQFPYAGYFGFTSVQWEELEMRRPSKYTVGDTNPFIWLATYTVTTRICYDPLKWISPNLLDIIKETIQKHHRLTCYAAVVCIKATPSTTVKLIM